MADGTIKVTEGVDKFLDAESLTVGANTVYRERVQIAGTGATDLAPVDATAGLKVNLGADNDVTVTGSVTANAGTNLNTSALALEAGGNLAAAATSLATLDNIVSGSEAQVDIVAPLPAGTNNIGDVDVLSSALPTGASTLAEQQSQTTALQIMDDWDNAASDGASVSGDVAHDSADAGEPVKIGAKAIAFGTNPTAVAANDRTNLYANRAGVQFTIGGHPNIVTAVYITTGAQTDDVVVAIAAGLKAVVTRITAITDEATTVGTACRVGFGASTLPALGASGDAAVAGLLLYHPGMVPGTGVGIGDGSGIIGAGADDEDIRITCEAPTSGTLSLSISYFTIES